MMLARSRETREGGHLVIDFTDRVDAPEATSPTWLVLLPSILSPSAFA